MHWLAVVPCSSATLGAVSTNVAPNSAAINEAKHIIAAAGRITVFSGAGISTDSGIPDFRGPNGVWTKNPEAEKVATLSHYLNDPEIRRIAWRNRLVSPAWSAQPNAGHRAVFSLEQRGVLVAVITQNIDGLHQQAGHPPHNVIEMHGTMRHSICWSCGDRRAMQETLQRVSDGDPDPSCELCNGVLKSDTISFGQALKPEVVERAMSASESCDVLLAVGSSLSVYPAANVVPWAKAASARVIIINGEPTAMDHYGDVVLAGNLSEILPQILT